jgi:hypothetical protein
MTVRQASVVAGDETAFSLGQLNDLGCDAVFGGGVGGSLAV